MVTKGGKYMSDISSDNLNIPSNWMETCIDFGSAELYNEWMDMIASDELDWWEEAFHQYEENDSRQMGKRQKYNRLELD